MDIINPKDLKHEVENQLTYFILEHLKNDSDGIIPLSKDTHEMTMGQRLIDDIEKMFGEEEVTEILNEMKQILGRDMDSWLSRDFFKKHISQYKKRPIVWHLKSPAGYFEVFIYYHKLNNQTLHILKKKKVKFPIENTKISEIKKSLSTLALESIGKGEEYWDNVFDRSGAELVLPDFREKLLQFIKFPKETYQSLKDENKIDAFGKKMIAEYGL